jgi:hypothetical protein
MPFKPNYRLQRADRQRAKEEKQKKKLLRQAEKGKGDEPDAVGDDAQDREPDTAQAELPH